MEAPRSRTQRRNDALAKLGDQIDLWVASAGDEGAYLIPVSFHWDGATLLVATPRASRTARNLIAAGRARVALGPTRDVLIIDGTVDIVAIGVDPEREDAHAVATGFDPRTLSDEYVYLRITPVAIQAWREANELRGRWLMKEGTWLE